MSTPFPFPTTQNVPTSPAPQEIPTSVPQVMPTRSSDGTLAPPKVTMDQPAKKEESKSSTILIVSVIVGLLVLAGGGYFAYNHLKGKSNVSNVSNGSSSSPVSTPGSSMMGSKSSVSSRV
jgi:hypothetical protein